MKAIILTGGLGTRLRPFTCDTPKPLLPVVNIPFIEYQILNLQKHGIKEILLATAYRPEKFKEILGTGARLGVKIHTIHEKTPLGTGGAVRNAYPKLTDTTLILNGDVLHHLDISGLLNFHKKNHAEVTLTLVSVKDPTRFGLVETDPNGRITRFLEKPSWDEVTCDTINAGAYVFELSAVKSIPAGGPASLERDLFPQLLEQERKLFAFTTKEYWMDFGTVENYLQAHLDILEGNAPFLPKDLRRQVCFLLAPGAKIAKGTLHEGSGTVVFGRKSSASARTRFIGSVCVGDGCTIDEGATLENCLILSGTHIGAGARITRAVIGEKCRIGEKAIVTAGTAIGDHSVIKEYSKI